MLLCLQSDLDDFHWGHNRHCLGSSSSETSWSGGREREQIGHVSGLYLLALKSLATSPALTDEDTTGADLGGLFIRQPTLVRCESQMQPAISTFARQSPRSRFEKPKSSPSKLANLMAILGTIPLMTAPRPLYRPNGVSRATICLAVA
jgi:hypothetical protein